MSTLKKAVFPTSVGMNRVRRLSRLCWLGVFPTSVGMNRIDATAIASFTCVPHKRGDEPIKNLRRS